jgi:hypothetical protein
VAAEGISVVAEGISVGCRLGQAPVSAVAEWAHGMVAIAIGAAKIGAAKIGAVVIRAPIDIITMDIITIMVTITEALIVSSSSATSAFHGGGAGVGAGVGAGATRTAITVTVTPMATAMATTATAMVATAMIPIGPVTISPVRLPPDQGSLSCSGDSPALVIIAALLTESWGLRRGRQFEPTSARREMRADRSPIFSPMGMS